MSSYQADSLTQRQHCPDGYAPIIMVATNCASIPRAPEPPGEACSLGPPSIAYVLIREQPMLVIADADLEHKYSEKMTNEKVACSGRRDPHHRSRALMALRNTRRPAITALTDPRAGCLALG